MSICIIDSIFSKEDKSIASTRREATLTIALRKWLSYFWYSFFTVSLLELFGLSISSLSSSEDVFLTFKDYLKSNLGSQIPDYDENNFPKTLRETWLEFDNFQRIGFCITYLPEFFLSSFYLVPVIILGLFNLLGLKHKGPFSFFSFSSIDNWLKEILKFEEEDLVDKKLKKEFVQKEISSCELKIKIFDGLKWVFTIIAVVGTVLAIKLSQGGSMIGVTSIVGTQLADKGKERNESTKNELEQMEKELNREFLHDFFDNLTLKNESSLNKYGKKPYVNFLKESVKLNNEGRLFSSVLNDIKNKEHSLVSTFDEDEDEIKRLETEKVLTDKLIEELRKNERKQQFLNDLLINWSENIDEIVENFWKELKDGFSKEMEIESSNDLGLNSLFEEVEQEQPKLDLKKINNEEITVEIPEIQLQPNSSTSIRRRISAASSNSLQILNLLL